MSSDQQPTEFDAILDASIISAFLSSEASPEIQAVIAGAMELYQSIGIPVIAYAEARFGIEFSPYMSVSMDDFYHHFGAVPVIPITKNTAKSYMAARQAAPLEKKRLNDTWIAASGLEHNATVLTGDDDFDGFVEYGLSVHKVPTI